MNHDYDPQYYPYASQRKLSYARKGMVATTQPLAAQAGLDMLKLGGNAVDAAIAAAASLTVLEPVSNSVGGDTFAIVWINNKLYGLNASGPAPQSISIAAVKQAGHQTMPRYGMIPVTVPGTPASWASLSERFGRLPLTKVLEPAIYYAEHGFPVSPTIGNSWKKHYETFKQQTNEVFQPWHDLYAPNGDAPAVGRLWRSPDHARTLRLIAESKAEAFYRGELAEKIDTYFQANGGFVTKEDLAAFRPEWVDPISVSYKGYDIWEMPPNGQGLVALSALNILRGMELPDKNAPETYHTHMEAVKLAFADGLQYITDPAWMKQSVKELLSEHYAAARRKQIGEFARIPETGHPHIGDTVYLAAADGEGNMVSFIQSHSEEFGAGIVVPGTGICMQNRGSSFSLDPDADNALAPGKKTRHTIIPGFITRQNEAVGAFGVMGGHLQPQGHVQVVVNLIDYHLNPQAALDAPRWRWTKDLNILVEPTFPEHVAQALRRKGHDLEYSLNPGAFGRGQIILRDPATGVLAGGTEPRADSAIAVW